GFGLKDLAPAVLAGLQINVVRPAALAGVFVLDVERRCQGIRRATVPAFHARHFLPGDGHPMLLRKPARGCRPVGLAGKTAGLIAEKGHADQRLPSAICDRGRAGPWASGIVAKPRGCCRECAPDVGDPATIAYASGPCRAS